MTPAELSPASPHHVAPGTRLNDIYEVDALIASGGMGEVYRGHTIHTGDPVAIKLLRPELGENEAALALFRKEASALHTLHHDSIVRYYVCSVDPDLRRPYLAMEFVDGQSLSQLLRQGPLTFEAVRNLGQRVAGGLHVAHERGIVHRDVAPDNVIIPNADVRRAKIIDFGIARFTQTQDGTIIGGGFAGKYKYVSPEQLGLFGGEVTAKSDIYSLGLVLAEALTGQAIDMAGSQVQVVEKRRKVPDLGGIDMRIRPLLERMLQPDPADRPESMDAVAAMIAASPTRTAVAARVPPPRIDVRWRRLGAATAGIVFFLAAAIVVLTQWEPESGAPQVPAPPRLQAGAGSGEGKSAAASPATGIEPAPPPALTPPAQTGAAAPDTPAPATPATPVLPTPPAPSLGGGTNLAVVPPGGAGANADAGRLSRIDSITRYVNDYDGGECFFATPISVGEAAARIEGYGASLKPFEALDSDFKNTNGFEAEIGVRQVTARQCPAVTFLGRLRAQHGSAPQLDIGQTSLRSGEVLTGTVNGFGDRNVELVLVSDDGSVNNLTALLKTTRDGKSFSLRMQLDNPNAAQPQLLMAIVSARPLAALQIDRPLDGAQVFPAVLAEAARSGLAVAAAARYFKLQ